MARKKPILTYFPAYQTATDEEIEAANQRDGRTGRDRFLPYAQERAILGDRRLQNADVEEVVRLLRHPDERVVAMALDKSAAMVFRRPQEEAERIKETLTALKARVLEDAEENGWAWTALMRAMARQGGAWRKGDVSPKQAATQKRKLIPWIRAQDDPASLLQLLNSDLAEVLLADYVAKEAKVLNHDLAWKIIDSGGSRAIQYITRNDALSVDLQHSLIEKGVQELEAGRQFRDVSRLIRAWVVDGEASLSSSQRMRLDALATDPSGPIQYSAREALMVLPDLPTTQIQRLWDAWREESSRYSGYQATSFMTHPNTPVEVLRFLARTDTRGQARIKLANNPAAIDDPEVRELLTESQGKQVLTELVKTADPERVDAMFDLLVRKNPEGAAELIGEGGLPDDFELRKEHLVRLLEHSSAEVRTNAIALVGKTRLR